MAHDLHYSEKLGRHAAFYSDHPAWHKLGTVENGLQNLESVAELCDMNYPMEVREFEYNGKKTGIYGVCRSDTNIFFSSCGPKYQPITPVETMEVMDIALNNIGGFHYAAGGQLGKGERFWLIAKIPHDFEIGEGDKHKTYLLGTGGHNGLPLVLKVVSERVECANMLAMALRSNGKEIRIPHTVNAKARLEQAKRILQGAVDGVETLHERLDFLAKKEVTKETLTEILAKLFPEKETDKRTTRRDNLIASILECYTNNDGNAHPEIAGTAYNLLNAITEYTDHIRGVRLTEGRKDLTEDNARAENALFGSGSDFKETAFEVIYETAQAMPYKNYITRAIEKGAQERASETPIQTSILDDIIDLY